MRFLLALMCSCAWAGTLDVSGLMTISDWQYSASGSNVTLPGDPGGLEFNVNDLGGGEWSVWATYDAGTMGLVSNPNYTQNLNIDFSFLAQADPGFYLTSETNFLSDTADQGSAASGVVSESTGNCTVFYGGVCPVTDTAGPLFIDDRIGMRTLLDSPYLPPSSVSVTEITDVFYLRQGSPCPEPNPAWLLVSGMLLLCAKAGLRVARFSVPQRASVRRSKA